MPGHAILDSKQPDEALAGQLRGLRKLLPGERWTAQFAPSSRAAATLASHEQVSCAEQAPKSASWIAYLPAGVRAITPDLSRVLADDAAVLPWPVQASEPSISCSGPLRPVGGWIMAPRLHRRLALPPDADLARVLRAVERTDVDAHWYSGVLSERRVTPRAVTPTHESRLNPHSRLLAIVPHYRCEAFLPRALASLLQQSLPPAAIVVIDDASGEPPIEICEQFPGVALYQATERSGPFRLVQSAIRQSLGFDGYLFQDADDWSALDRVERLLQTAERTGAELVGTQEMRVEADGQFHPVAFPIDVNDMVCRAETPTHPLLHPTSVLARSLFERAGGFATGMRYSGDTEFLYRALLVGRIVNVDAFSYYYRQRPESLTNSPDTGLRSHRRLHLLRRLRARCEWNLFRQQHGQPISLQPESVLPEVPLRHCTGPSVLA
ncbi:MAG: glycosyltransferase family 2 protein [Pseudomonadota bacterium]